MIARLSRILNDPIGRVRFDRWAPTIVVLLAAFLRFWNLGYPHKLVFDETYYVKDAWTLSHLGYESNWLNDANTAFEGGDPTQFATAPSFVVHPPLGKWLISIGMNLFGPQNSWSWRIVCALFGVLAVVLLMLVAKLLMKSTLWAVVAGFLFAIDGHAIVLARTALLDNFLMFFVLLAFYFLLRDREAVEIELARRSADHAWMGVIWNRWWLIATGVALGAATAVKWSGLYFALAFGLYTVISETLLRRRIYKSGIGRGDWLLTGVAGQGVANFMLMIPIAFLTYLSSWTGWLVTKGGFDRGWADSVDRQATGFWSWVPTSLQSLWQFHKEAYGFHLGLHTPHSYASSPLTWLFLWRPTSFFYEGSIQGDPGCNTYTSCSSAITALGNPLIWLGATAAVLYLTYRYFRTGDRIIGLILLGLAAGYLPWMMYLQRTVFQFYVIAFEPWMILALVFAMRSMLKAEKGFYWRKTANRIAVFLLLTTVVSVYFYPIWTGITVPYWFWLSHMWLPTWI